MNQETSVPSSIRLHRLDLSHDHVHTGSGNSPASDKAGMVPDTIAFLPALLRADLNTITV